MPGYSIRGERKMTIMEHFIMLHNLYRQSGRQLPPQDIRDIYKIVFRLKCKSEIIGSWVYCFVSPEIGAQLLIVGFWYSYKHEAFVYSGFPKSGPADDEGLDEIRARLESHRIVQSGETSR
jgi:hypothetical protein